MGKALIEVFRPKDPIEALISEDVVIDLVNTLYKTLRKNHTNAYIIVVNRIFFTDNSFALYEEEYYHYLKEFRKRIRNYKISKILE